MSSERRIAASRANGKLSKGPVTPEGKERSARNSLRHGLLAKIIVLTEENREDFDAMYDYHVARFKPVDDVEYGIVEELVVAAWRLRRAWFLENEALDSTGWDLTTAPSFPLIQRYETRLHLMYARSMKNLRMLRKDFAPNEPNPISDHPDMGRLLSCVPVSTGATEPQCKPEPTQVPNPPTGASGGLAQPIPAAPPAFPNEPNPISEHRPSIPDPTHSRPAAPCYTIPNPFLARSE